MTIRLITARGARTYLQCKTRYARTVARFAAAACLLAFSATASAQDTARPNGMPDWGTFHHPFQADSPWNSRPVNPEFGSYVIPPSKFRPLIGGGDYSLTVFLAKPTDPPMRVRGYPGSRGLWDPDAEEFQDEVTIPHWPADVAAAEGNDGHADIVDLKSGRIHSFHKLRYRDGVWIASQYAWSRVNGRGWGDPAHYFQGARAAGVPSSGGLIRKHEINDGQPYYRHALAVSLTMNAMSPQPSFIYPATSGDGNAAKTNSGRIPEGALLMLPPSFDTDSLTSPGMRKIAETLKRYGAYVVDRNYGTPFYIYVENGADFSLRRSVSSTAVDQDLERIRVSLRQMVSAAAWLDGEGKATVEDRNLNLLSMRGPWRVQSGITPGRYDTWAQAVVFPQTREKTVQVNTSSRLLRPVYWAMPQAGTDYRVTAHATGGASLRLHIIDKADKSTLFDSGELSNGEKSDFKWPSAGAIAFIYAISGVGGESTVRGSIVAVDQPGKPPFEPANR
jgi:hypothetical protein